MSDLTSPYAYKLCITKGLWKNWPWFESRGYLPKLPGILLSALDTDIYQQDKRLLDNEVEYTLGMQEHEAWEFDDACKDLGSDFGTCLGMRDLSMIEEFRAEIV